MIIDDSLMGVLYIDYGAFSYTIQGTLATDKPGHPDPPLPTEGTSRLAGSESELERANQKALFIITATIYVPF
jgi:hypothetical protein